MNQRMMPRPASFRSVKVLSITSGKGGVGKTNIVANLATLMQKAGKKVLVLDGDFGLANLNIVMGLEPRGTIQEVITGDKEIEDIVLTGPSGLKLLPASSGIFQMSQLSMTDKTLLLDKIEASSMPFDVLIIDTGAGINSDVTYLNTMANDVVVVTTPEPTSMADAYALMKVMSQQHKVKNFKLLVNMVSEPKEGLAVYENLLSVSDRFLNISIEYLGHIVYDKRVSHSVMARRVHCEGFPQSQASSCLSSIAGNLIQNGESTRDFTGHLQFFWRSVLSDRNRGHMSEVTA